MLLDVVTTFLEQAAWPHDRNSGSVVRALHDGESGTFPVYFKADDEHEQMVVYGVVDHRVDADHRMAVGAFLAALNYGFAIGGFEMDLGDGEVRFRAGIDVSGGELTTGMVRSLAASCVVNVDLYGPAIRAVATGTMSPAEALDDVGM